VPRLAVRSILRRAHGGRKRCSGISQWQTLDADWVSRVQRSGRWRIVVICRWLARPSPGHGSLLRQTWSGSGGLGSTLLVEWHGVVVSGTDELCLRRDDGDLLERESQRTSQAAGCSLEDSLLTLGNTGRRSGPAAVRSRPKPTGYVGRRFTRWSKRIASQRGKNSNGIAHWTW
jgi:hypothetical protein